MSNFDYMFFDSGYMPTAFVVHAKKYTKDEAIELCKDNFKENGEELDPIIFNTIKQKYVRYYVKVPMECGHDTEGGCYTYCEKGTRGSFPVWNIRLEEEI